MNSKIELTNTYVNCKSWSVEDKIKYMKLCIGNDLPHEKICGWASKSFDSLMDIYSKCTFIYFNGSMLSQDQCDKPTLANRRTLITLNEIDVALEEKKPNQYESVAKDLPKKRTKVEYEYVSGCIFDLKDDFESGILYCKQGGEYLNITNSCSIGVHLASGGLYRRIETPITEREAFIETAIHELESGMSDRDYAKALFDSGKFKLVN